MTKIAQGEWSGKKNLVFLAIPEPQPVLGEAKVAQGEWSGKKNLVFLAIPEPQPALGGAKVVQSEWREGWYFSCQGGLLRKTHTERCKYEYMQ